MPDSVIPGDVREFILENIDSIAQLEGLLLLRANPSFSYSAKTIADRLYISESETHTLLARLFERGLIIQDEKSQNYSYQPKSEELRSMVDKISDTYTQYLLPVTHLVHSKAKTRVQEFANAFKIRKD
jgi:DNA-binding IclR family transcriptional regulator